MLTYTTINHAFRKANNLSANEYILCDMIYHLSNNPESITRGWCYMKRETMASEIGITKMGLLRMLDRLIQAGFIEKHTETKYLRPTSKWYACYSNINSNNSNEQSTPSVNKVYSDGKQSLPSEVNKVYSDGKQSSPNNNIYIDTKDNDINNKGVSKKNEGEFKLPFDDKQFVQLWEKLLQMKKWRNKSRESIEMALRKLGRENLHTAITCLENAIAGEWQGIYPPTDTKYQQQKNLGSNAKLNDIDYTDVRL